MFRGLLRRLEVDKLWRVDLGADTRTIIFLLTPFVDSERVFAAEPGGRVAALDVQTGRIEWERNLKESLSAGVGVGEGLLIVATRDGEVVALERASGEQRWRVKMGAEILARPVVAAGVVILRSGDGQVIGVDSGSGEIRWRVRRAVPGLSVRGLSAPSR